MAVLPGMHLFDPDVIMHSNWTTQRRVCAECRRLERPNRWHYKSGWNKHTAFWPGIECGITFSKNWWSVDARSIKYIVIHDTGRINTQLNNMNWTHTDTGPIFKNTGRYWEERQHVKVHWTLRNGHVPYSPWSKKPRRDTCPVNGCYQPPFLCGHSKQDMGRTGSSQTW